MPLDGDAVILLSSPRPPILSQQPNIYSLSQGGRSSPPNPLIMLLTTVLAHSEMTSRLSAGKHYCDGLVMSVID